MSNRKYWLNLFTGATWEDRIKVGVNASSYKEKAWNRLKKIKKGDYLLSYITGISRWIGIVEVVSEPYKDPGNKLGGIEFPCSIGVKEIVRLEFETAIPVTEFIDQVSFVKKMDNPSMWRVHFQQSLRQYPKEDGELVVKYLLNAQKNPVKRPYDKKKLKLKPKAVQSRKMGSVTVPEDEPETEFRDVTIHTEIQWALLKLGNDMGLDVWVARNDRGKEVKGNKFSNLSRILNELPLQFDEATTKTIELIDVLWLKGKAIVAAFEIESTTAIYSGLLRMSDLITMQPNITIPLFIVAPDDKRTKVMSEINRPTFGRLNPPLRDLCRYLSFSTLQEHVPRVSEYIRYLKPEFLDDIAETCEVDEH